MALTTAISNNNSQCCFWDEKNGFCAKENRRVAQIALLIISVITLTIAVFVALVSMGSFGRIYPLYVLQSIAPFGSGVLITMSAIAAVIALGLLLHKAHQSKVVEKISRSPIKEQSPPVDEDEDFFFL